MTKEAALEEFGRRANSMTYDKGAGYLFGTGYDGITILAPDPKQVGHQSHGRGDQWQKAVPGIDERREGQRLDPADL